MNDSSSFRILPTAEDPTRRRRSPVAPVLPVLGPELVLDKVTANVSLFSTAVSPLTLTVMVWVAAELAAKMTRSMGVLKVFATKSVALAALPPVPVTLVADLVVATLGSPWRR